MGYQKKAKAAEANAEENVKDKIVISDVEVVRAQELDIKSDDPNAFKIAFDIKVRGISISGMFFQSYKTQEGKEGTMITFPSYKARNGKYYNHVWFPIDQELKDGIINKIDSLLG